MLKTTADAVIKSMYEAINRRDITAAMEFIDDNCVYQDLNFPQLFQGKQAVQQLLEESCKGIPDDLLFVIDDISTGDDLAVGVLWHVELDGIPFPNGRGVSFYRLSATTGKLEFARDIVEPPIKPGKKAFLIIRLVTPLVRRFLHSPTGHSAPPNLWLSTLLWVLAAIYLYALILSPPGQIIPGEPVWAIRPETLQEIINESLNFFLVLPILNLLGITYMEAPIVHPASEALFNLAEAWIFMFLPLLLADPRGRNLPKVGIWGMAMFLTNVFLIPYMALRLNTPLPEERDYKKYFLARIFGWIGLIVGSIAIFWGFVGRPEFGDLASRGHYFLSQITTNRVAIAFCVDLTLFYIFQVVLLGTVISQGSKTRWLRFVPFWGLAVSLIKNGE
ncbi:nuclear transport factor 2 family protein [Calothrix rhizosoleniae]|uniref:nuclear transport factor 2 family protein n=1 Tax=Calothrix rhizosoleniae TaxID=888997 RepID=UPI000B4A3CD4|nr:nuclear transport factor 2 family protein [Calothrix rhizosoleniae]